VDKEQSQGTGIVVVKRNNCGTSVDKRKKCQCGREGVILEVKVE